MTVASFSMLQVWNNLLESKAAQSSPPFMTQVAHVLALPSARFCSGLHCDHAPSSQFGDQSGKDLQNLQKQFWICGC
jgi:hypothetical protein